MKKKQIQAFYRTHARVYDLTRPFFLFGRQKAVDLLDLQPGESVIDFGCGTGMNIPSLIDKGAKDILGVDYSSEMLDQAKRKFPSVEFKKADLTSFTITKKYDKAICTYALSIMEPWEKAILTMRKCLTKNGSLVVLDFCPLKGLLAPLDPFLRGWLTLFGVDHRKSTVSGLNKCFRNVHLASPPFGYYFIARAHSSLD